MKACLVFIITFIIINNKNNISLSFLLVYIITIVVRNRTSKKFKTESHVKCYESKSKYIFCISKKAPDNLFLLFNFFNY